MARDLLTKATENYLFVKTNAEYFQKIHFEFQHSNGGSSHISLESNNWSLVSTKTVNLGFRDLKLIFKKKERKIEKSKGHPLYTSAISFLHSTILGNMKIVCFCLPIYTR